MKNSILFLMMIFLSLQGFAQEKNSFFSVNTGVAIPLGNFKAQSVANGSFALPGINVSAEGAWYLKEHFGVGAEIGMELNPIDASSLAKATLKSDPFLTNLTIRAEAFQVVHGGLGLFTHWEIYHKLSLTAKVLGGMIWGKTPYQLYKPTYFGAGPDYYEITSSKDHEYFVEPGLGLQYKFNSSVGFQITSEYITRKMGYGFINTDGSYKVEYKQVDIINTLAGLVIYL